MTAPSKWPITSQPWAYLGIGVYVAFNGFGLCLRVQGGQQYQDEIFLDSEAYEALLQYVARISASKPPSE
jgi:hypothetical protein